jgi:putative transposase
MIQPGHPRISISRQCELIGLSRAAYYKGVKGISELNLKLMDLIDEIYTETPFYGVRKITKEIKKKGYKINRKRIRRLMRLMGLEAIYPKPKLSIPNIEHKIYPYLLRGLDIDHSNQVWCSDITYIRTEEGFVYLTVVMDWYSRYVLSWELSTTIDSSFCISTLKDSFRYGLPEIFNTDQGSQYTSEDFTKELRDRKIKISMDGRGRALDNVMVERLWRSVKYEDVYIKSYRNVKEARNSLRKYFDFYNTKRMHQSLDDKTPAEIYFNSLTGERIAA